MERMQKKEMGYGREELGRILEELGEKLMEKLSVRS